VAALKSLTITNPSLVFDEPNKTIYRHPESITDSKNKISIICGGGSGHEPGWVGYTGCGGLTACVAGSIFASPAAEQVRRCVAHRLPKESTGLLVLAANYTGDVLNFGMGAEKARAMGKDVEMVVMGDDVGVGRKKAGKVGRRGVAGAAFVLKAAGALAEMGASLQDCAHVGRLVVDNVVSIGTSLSRVHVNGMPTSEADEELRRLPYGTSELGMGIHNEPGCEKLETDFPDTIRKMLSQILDLSDQDRAFVDIKSTDRVAMIINNFGGLSNLEIGALLNEVWEQLGKSYGIKPVRVYSGVYNGSLNGLGFTVSLLKLVDTGLGAGRSLLDLIDAPAEIIGWPQQIPVATWDRPFSSLDQTEPEGEKPRPSTLQGE
jgi:dihydroxyacetone kinase